MADGFFEPDKKDYNVETEELITNASGCQDEIFNWHVILNTKNND